MKIDIVKALKDSEYRDTLPETVRALIPMNAAGTMELDDQDLETFAAGRKTRQTYSCTQTSGTGTCSCTCNAGRLATGPTSGDVQTNA
jgi:mersacidin/lichenicidin family type 2 lantibiotic